MDKNHKTEKKDNFNQMNDVHAFPCNEMFGVLANHAGGFGAGPAIGQ
jgi:hypothetical protein